MAYSESHDLVVAGDTIGNAFSWKVGEVAAANTDDGETPPHHALGGPFHTKRWSLLFFSCVSCWTEGERHDEKCP